MPINVYTGLMRSGKSYEVVSTVILDAIAAGRRVVTNVDGIDNDKIRAYLHETRNIDLDKLGTVFHVTNEDVFGEKFLPYYDDVKAAHTDTVVQPGDLVCIDEAWRFWGTDCKIHKNHKSFFLEHGHFTHPETGVACDIVLMIQDMGTLHRFVKNVVAFSFRTHKKVSLGLGNTYSINMYEGWKQNSKTQSAYWVKTYKKEIFPLYQSFKGGAEGKTVNVDSRQNLLMNKRLWVIAGVMVCVGIASVYGLASFFMPSDGPKTAKAKTSGAQATPTPTAPPAPAAPPVSPQYRVSGHVSVDGLAYVVITDAQNGGVRLVPASSCFAEKLFMACTVDGQHVTTFSGVPAKSLFSGEKK